MQVNYLHPLTFGMTDPLFTGKFYSVKSRFFQRNSTFDHSKNEIKEDHSKCSKVDNSNLHLKRSFIDKYIHAKTSDKRVRRFGDILAPLSRKTKLNMRLQE